MTDTVSDTDIEKYSLICVTENLFNLTRLIDINKQARAKNIGFILAEALGPLVYTFLDYGDKHTIFDPNGEQTRSVIVSNITREEKPTVTVHEDKRHGFYDGDHVVFSEVEGMTELNGHKPIEIYDCSGHSFKLKLDTSKFGAYVRQGLVEDKKVPFSVKFKPLAE